MFKRILSVGMILVSVLLFNTPCVKADQRDEEIASLKSQVAELLKRTRKLEADQAATKETADKLKEQAPSTTPRVDLERITSKLKIKGRWAAGFYNSGSAGLFTNGSFEVPEAKLWFTFTPDEINSILMRLNFNNATFNNVDLFWLDSNLSKFFNLSKLYNVPITLNSRLGRFKFDFGEETWINSPVESVVPSLSASNVNGTDIGAQLSGSIGKDRPLGWSASVTNGASGSAAGVGSDTTESKAFTGKIFYNPIDPVYVSFSYYNSGQLGTSNSEMSIAGLASRPTGATHWNRQAYEFDLQYNFGGKGKIVNPAYFDGKAFLRFAYGQFADGATGGISSKRDGSYGWAEGLYNLTKKFYAAGRYSVVDLEGSDLTATLNNVTANRYERYSFGLGYRWSAATILKLGYDINKNTAPNSHDRPDNLLSAIVASQF